MSEEELKRMKDFINATLEPYKPNEYRLGYEDALRRCYYLVDNLQQENKHLNLQLDQALKDYEELLIKIDKAIEYIQKRFEINEYGEYYFTHTFDNSNMKELLAILGDKENE